MLITNKRVTLPQHFKCDATSIEVFDEFKMNLLGVLIDKK